jgi:DNA-binding transcriptional ArsR family regulator
VVSIELRSWILSVHVLQILIKSPHNKLDYKTIVHHLDVLSKNGLIITDNKESYGAIYFLTPLMEKNFESFREILAKIKQK